jgi:hypothetical protein
MHEKLTFKERLQTLKLGQIIWPLFIILVILGIGVGIYNYQKNVTANKLPTVEVTSPTDNQKVNTQTTKVTGTVEEGSKVMIGNKQVTVDEAGSFTYNLPLNAGENTVTIVVTGKNGKSNITTRRITYTIPVTASTQYTNQAVAGSLSKSGPENFWIPEAALIAAAAVGYFMTRQELAKALNRQY